MREGFKEAQGRLYEIAETQQGFFTTKQAIHAGFGEKTHSYHVRVGNWIREHRGIYRLAEFPTTDRPDLMLCIFGRRTAKKFPRALTATIRL
jgi:hypothetical protein